MGWILPAAQLGMSAYGMYKASQDDPAARQQEYMRQMYEKYFSPAAINRGTQQGYQNWINSPAYQSGLYGLTQSAQRATSGMLGYGGIRDSQNAMRGLTFAPGLMQMKLGGWNQAGQQYMQGAQAAMQGGASMPQPSYGAPQMAGSILNALSQYGTLNPRQQQQQPQMYNPAMYSNAYNWVNKNWGSGQ